MAGGGVLLAVKKHHRAGRGKRRCQRPAVVGGGVADPGFHLRRHVHRQVLASRRQRQHRAAARPAGGRRGGGGDTGLGPGGIDGLQLHRAGRAHPVDIQHQRGFDQLGRRGAGRQGGQVEAQQPGRPAAHIERGQAAKIVRRQGGVDVAVGGQRRVQRQRGGAAQRAGQASQAGQRVGQRVGQQRPVAARALMRVRGHGGGFFGGEVADGGAAADMKAGRAVGRAGRVGRCCVQRGVAVGRCGDAPAWRSGAPRQRGLAPVAAGMPLRLRHAARPASPARPAASSSAAAGSGTAGEWGALMSSAIRHRPASRLGNSARCQAAPGAVVPGQQRSHLDQHPHCHRVQQAGPAKAH